MPRFDLGCMDIVMTTLHPTDISPSNCELQGLLLPEARVGECHTGLLHCLHELGTGNPVCWGAQWRLSKKEYRKFR